MSLLTIVRNAANRLGLEALSSVAANTNETARRMFGLVNEAVTDIGRRHDWQALRIERTFLTTAAEVQEASAIPVDFDRFVDETIWNRTAIRPLIGPSTAREWALLKSTNAPITSDTFMIRGNRFVLAPIPSAGQTIAYEYVSNYWVAETSAPTTGTQSQFELDSDVAILDEEMLTKDLVWRYKASRGLSYAEAFRQAELTIADRWARDGSRRTLDLSRGARRRRPFAPVIASGSIVIPTFDSDT